MSATLTFASRRRPRAPRSLRAHRWPPSAHARFPRDRQELMGHVSMETTAGYLHPAVKTVSPLDRALVEAAA